MVFFSQNICIHQLGRVYRRISIWVILINPAARIMKRAVIESGMLSSCCFLINHMELYPLLSFIKHLAIPLTLVKDIVAVQSAGERVLYTSHML